MRLVELLVPSSTTTSLFNLFCGSCECPSSTTPSPGSSPALPGHKTIIDDGSSSSSGIVCSTATTAASDTEDEDYNNIGLPTAAAGSIDSALSCARSEPFIGDIIAATDSTVQKTDKFTSQQDNRTTNKTEGENPDQHDGEGNVSIAQQLPPQPPSPPRQPLSLPITYLKPTTAAAASTTPDDGSSNAAIARSSSTATPTSSLIASAATIQIMSSDESNNNDDGSPAKLYERIMKGQGPYDRDANDGADFDGFDVDGFDEDFSSVPFPSDPAGLTPPRSNNGSNVSTPASRERTLTDGSNSSEVSDSSGSVSKRTLVKLMREQVDLVKSLTNAQLAQKKELERLKLEKKQLEEERRREKEQLEQERRLQQQQQQGQTQSQSAAAAPRPAAPHYRQHPDATNAASSAPPPAAPPQEDGRLNLPTHHPSGPADNKSISSRSFVKFVSEIAAPLRARAGTHDSNGAPPSYPRRHPDAAYFRDSARRGRTFTADSSPGNNAYENNTLSNGNPSVASTIMPSAILIDSNKAHTTGAFCDDSPPPHSPAYTGPGAYGYHRDRIEITHIPERNVVTESKNGCGSKLWLLFSRFCTLFVPDFLLCCIGRHAEFTKGMTPAQKKEVRAAKREAKQAWREKVAIFAIMMLASACFIGISGVVPMFLCRETSVFTMDEIGARDHAEDWTVIFGTIYDIKHYISAHPGGGQIRDLIAKDASKVFPRRPPGVLPSTCINREKELSQVPTCDEFDEVDKLVNLYCHTDAVGFKGVDRYMGDYHRGDLAHRPSSLANDPHTQWIMIYNRIYNVTRYVDSIKDEVTGQIDVRSSKAYLSDDLNSLIVNKRGEDATMVYEALYDDDIALSCLDDLFYVGILDEPNNVLCRALNIAMYSVMIIIAAVLAIQCVCSLVYLVRMNRTITRDDTRSKIIVMVPCYNEGDKELRKTIDSVMDTSYPDDNKVLLVVADGIITGKGERCSTPETLSRILGYKMSPNDRSYKCKSIGEHTENRAKIHYGIYKDAGKELKYLVIVKCGLPSEKGTARAGNRGKRDSQLLFTGLLNRFHHGRELNDLDKAIKHALEHLQLPLDEVRYLMAIDADTRVDRESISHMTYSMNKNDHILALCGETKVDNKAQSWVTMIQVFEYYTNHHMKKAFESVFGCVTCLPGCFTMYRLFSDDGRPLLSCDDVYQRYATNDVKTLHDKNLYHLGEDRMLTTLLLRYFPDMRLSFVPEATCYTIVPHTFSVLLSQRRRWINSTFHNMLELVRVNTMCGVCCLSMKSVVVLDLVATLILPASLIYVGYIVYITFWMGEPLSLLMLVVWGIVVGVQVVVFLLRSRWDYWWWFLVFVLAGVPVFYFILPLYSFWHMDDFSWGATRQVSGPTGNASANVNSTKSGDETVTSDQRNSPVGFEVVDSKVIDAEECDLEAYHRPSSGGKQGSPRASRKAQHSHAHSHNRSAQANDRAAAGKLSLKPKLHGAPHPVDVDDVLGEDFSCEVTTTSAGTKFDPSKYRDAEEAKKARRERRREC